MNITIATGGSGGHVIPALKVARELQKRKCEVRFAGAFNVWKERIAQAGFPFDELELCGIDFARPIRSARVSSRSIATVRQSLSESRQSLAPQ